MNNYPYLVYRAIPGFYINNKIKIVSPGDHPAIDAHTLVWKGSIYDANGEVLPEARRELREIGFRQQEKSRLRVCMVYGPMDCDYFERGGYIQPSDSIPQMSMKLADGMHVVDIGVESDDSGQSGSIENVSFQKIDPNGEKDENPSDSAPADRLSDLRFIIEKRDCGPLIKADGKEWYFYVRKGVLDQDHPTIESAEWLEENPADFVRLIESLDDSPEFVEVLKLPPRCAIAGLFDKYDIELRRLKNRVVLLEKYGSGMVDSFVDRIALSGSPRSGYTIESSIETAWDDDNPLRLNSLCEGIVSRTEGLRTASEITKAIRETVICEYDRWEPAELDWDKVLEAIRSDKPKLAAEIGKILEEDRNGYVN
jgi:hypothetical protein